MYKPRTEKKSTLIENDHLGDWSSEKDCYLATDVLTTLPPKLISAHVFTANHITRLPTATVCISQQNFLI